MVLDTGFGFIEYLVEFERLSSGLGLNVLCEWGVAHGEDIENGPGENDDREDEFAKCIAGHSDQRLVGILMKREDFFCKQNVFAKEVQDGKKGLLLLNWFLGYFALDSAF